MAMMMVIVDRPLMVGHVVVDQLVMMVMVDRPLMVGHVVVDQLVMMVMVDRPVMVGYYVSILVVDQLTTTQLVMQSMPPLKASGELAERPGVSGDLEGCGL